MKRILDSGVQIAASARGRLIANAEEEYRKLLPAAEVKVTACGIELSGRALMGRWLRDSALRFVGGTLR